MLNFTLVKISTVKFLRYLYEYQNNAENTDNPHKIHHIKQLSIYFSTLFFMICRQSAKKNNTTIYLINFGNKVSWFLHIEVIFISELILHRLHNVTHTADCAWLITNDLLICNVITIMYCMWRTVWNRIPGCEKRLHWVKLTFDLNGWPCKWPFTNIDISLSQDIFHIPILVIFTFNHHLWMTLNITVVDSDF